MPSQESEGSSSGRKRERGARRSGRREGQGGLVLIALEENSRQPNDSFEQLAVHSQMLSPSTGLHVGCIVWLGLPSTFKNKACF